MNVRTIAAMLAFSLVVSQHIVSTAQGPQRGKKWGAAPPATASSPLGLEIQRYLAQLRQDSLHRALRHAPPPVWFDSWDDTDPWFDAWDDADPRLEGADELEPWPDGQALEPPVGCQGGLAISLAEVDGHIEIEAAVADSSGWQKFRASGSREEIDTWVKELPPRLRKAIRRHLAEPDGADAPACAVPQEEPQPNSASQPE
jgi:hypothetical protein